MYYLFAHENISQYGVSGFGNLKLNINNQNNIFIFLFDNLTDVLNVNDTSLRDI